MSSDPELIIDGHPAREFLTQEEQERLQFHRWRAYHSGNDSDAVDAMQLSGRLVTDDDETKEPAP